MHYSHSVTERALKRETITHETRYCLLLGDFDQSLMIHIGGDIKYLCFVH